MSFFWEETASQFLFGMEFEWKRRLPGKLSGSGVFNEIFNFYLKLGKIGNKAGPYI